MIFGGGRGAVGAGRGSGLGGVVAWDGVGAA
jgi:hypothetical protein